MVTTTPRYGLGMVPQRWFGGRPQNNHFGSFLTKIDPPKNGPASLSSLRLIVYTSDTFCTRDQGLFTYVLIVANGVDYLEIWLKHGRGVNFLGVYTPHPPIIQRTAVRARERYIQVLIECKYRFCATPPVDAAISNDYKQGYN